MRALPVWFAVMTAMMAAAADASAAPAQVGFELTGRGTQVYACQEAAGGYAWVLRGPDAKLYDASGRLVGRHFFGPQWQARDGSRIRGKLLVSSASPAGAANAPWLVLGADVEQGGGLFGDIRMVTRTVTKGGGAPRASCGPPQRDQVVHVPYSARYTFFPAATPAQR